MTTFTSPFTGDIVQPTDVSYYDLSFSTNTALAWPTYATPGGPEVALARIMDCTASTSGLEIALPPGGQGAVGSDVLFRNIGANTFVVTDFSGDQSVTIAAGEARYFYLTDNSTEDGSWGNFQYGTGTSAADAASLVGAGLTNIAGKLATSTSVTEIFTAPTLSAASRATAFVWTSGAATINLPAAADLTTGWYIILRNNGTGTLEVTPAGSSTINGQVTQAFNPFDSAIIVFNKTDGNFYTIGLARPSNVVFTSATYDVDSVVGNTLDLTSYAPIIETYVALSGTRTADLAVELPATTQLYVFINNTGQTGYDITFQISGSSQAPVVFTNGTVATVLSDGNELFVITQSTVTDFFAADGSESAPSFSFSNDTSTGMYLKNASYLALTAGATDMLLLDNTNIASPLLSTDARFKAGLIDGGTF